MHKLLIGITIVFLFFYFFNEGFAITTKTTTPPPASGQKCPNAALKLIGSNCYVCTAKPKTGCNTSAVNVFNDTKLCCDKGTPAIKA